MPYIILFSFFYLCKARRLEEEVRLLELVDVTIGSFPEEIALRYLRIALLCTEESVQDRPTMSSILSMLCNSSVTIPSGADPPDYEDDRDNIDSTAAGRQDLLSVNSITITLLKGR